ncbi:MAG: hypothetical protein H7240_01380 [Glaciimonas sp.]|nr:hypothetical protein [Glaciimonas sp.]
MPGIRTSSSKQSLSGCWVLLAVTSGFMVGLSVALAGAELVVFKSSFAVY